MGVLAYRRSALVSRQAQLLAEPPKRQDRRRAAFEVTVTKVNLKEARDRRAFGEVADRRAHTALAALALDGEERLAVLQHNDGA